MKGEDMSTPRETGRVVVVTGAGGGVGAELVKRFLTNGDTVIATDLSPDAIDKLSADIGARDRLVTLAADITDEADVARLAEAVDDNGGLHVLVNGAGFFPIDTFENTTPDRWRQVIDINLTGSPMPCCP